MDATTTSFDLEITDAALAKVKAAMAQQELPEADRNLRLFVESGGGCGGLSFGIAFDRVEDRDQRIERGGLTVVVDPVSAPYLNGAHIDFVETDEVVGFKVTAPQAAAGGCSSASSCGSASSSCSPDPSGCSTGAHGTDEGGGGCC